MPVGVEFHGYLSASPQPIPASTGSTDLGASVGQVKYASRISDVIGRIFRSERGIKRHCSERSPELGKDRDWGKLLLAAIPIHGLDDYVDNVKLALRDHGVPVLERSVDGGYDMDGPGEDPVRDGWKALPPFSKGPRLRAERPAADSAWTRCACVLARRQTGPPSSMLAERLPVRSIENTTPVEILWAFDSPNRPRPRSS